MAAAAQYLRVVVNAERRYALWPHARRVPRGWADTYFVGSRLRCLAQITELTRHHAAACPAAPGAAQGRTAIGRLGRVAAGAPYRTAVLGAGFRLTFADLDRRANALARTIAEHGVRRGDLVGLRLRPGADAVVARLAALKAAAAYLPMDDESAVARPGLRLIVTEPEWSGPARRRGLPVLAWTRRDRGAGRVPARADQVEPHDPAFVVPGPAPGGGLVVDHGRLVLAARSAGGPTGCTASGPWRDELAIWGRLLRGEPIRYGARAELLLLEQEGRFAAHRRKQALSQAGEQPGQRHLDAHIVVEHVDGAGRGLPEPAHLEAQRVAAPDLLLDGDQRAEIAAHGPEPALEPARLLVLAKLVWNRDRDRRAHAPTGLQ